ncbi:MAG: hypothetical protein CM15mP65_09960 [Crocinitomicaceae bacterium]|nr:MAG: hypothetical protein CM15mP65_09960 [Crocinitomicaceae bacterium]
MNLEVIISEYIFNEKNYKLQTLSGLENFGSLFGKDLPATKYLSQRNKNASDVFIQKEKVVIENKTQQVDRIVDISEKI